MVRQIGNNFKCKNIPYSLIKVFHSLIILANKRYCQNLWGLIEDWLIPLLQSLRLHLYKIKKWKRLYKKSYCLTMYMYEYILGPDYPRNSRFICGQRRVFSFFVTSRLLLLSYCTRFDTLCFRSRQTRNI